MGMVPLWLRPLPTRGVSQITLRGSREAFLPAHTVGRRPLVIFAHGNGEVIDYWTEALDGFRERNVGVLLVEYPGYGRSGGTPSEGSIGAALVAAYDRIVTDSRVDRARIVGFGQSLGGGAICLLARRRPLAAAARHGTFRLYDCGHLCWDPRRLPFWKDATPFLSAAGILLEEHAP
jgi:pimeloyl-ACP methyl ester carboxylesterase